MEKTTKKLKIDIKGNILKEIYDFAAKYKAQQHGVTTHAITHHSPNHVEVLLEGEKGDLWKLVHWNKKGPIMCTVDEIVFEFVDITTDVTV